MAIFHCLRYIRSWKMLFVLLLPLPLTQGEKHHDRSSFFAAPSRRSQSDESDCSVASVSGKGFLDLPESPPYEFRRNPRIPSLDGHPLA
jgi:hypothetical protein